MKKILVFLMMSISLIAQEKKDNELTYNEFLGYVKKYHPMVKSANLQINNAQANLMMARGGFDPKIEVDFDKKQFKDKTYYSILNSSFKIPTWYGIEVKAGFDNSEGVYLNRENTLPNKGLSSLGINLPLGQGLLINQRMAESGRFWQQDGFDHLVRSETQFEHFRRYISDNPRKARLKSGEYVMYSDGTGPR